jgi:hypothetical protein
VESKEKIRDENKIVKKSPNKKWHRSQSLNKNYYKQRKANRSPTKKQDTKYKFTSNIVMQNNNNNLYVRNFDPKIRQNKPKYQTVLKRKSAINSEMNHHTNRKYIPKRKTSIGVNNIKSDILDNFDINDNKDIIKRNIDNNDNANLNKSFTSNKNSNQKRKYERRETKKKTFIFEENISQIKNEANSINKNKMSNQNNNKALKDNNDEIINKKNENTINIQIKEEPQKRNTINLSRNKKKKTNKRREKKGRRREEKTRRT